LNRRAGMRGAVLDGVFIDSNVEYRRGFDIRLSLRGAYDVFDYYREWIALNIDGTTNLRGVDLSDFRFLYQSSSVSYDHRLSSATTELTLRAETAAPAGVKYSPTVPINTNTPEYTPPDLDIGFTPVPDATVLLPGYDPTDPQLPIRVFALSSGGPQAAIAETFDSGTGVINWTEISTGLTGIGRWAAGDPYNYGRMFVLMSTGLYKCEDIWSFDSWTLVATPAAMLGDALRIGLKIQMNITKRGHIIVGSGSELAVSFDYGLTWAQVDPSGAGAFSTSTAIDGGDFAISQAGGGVVYFTYYIGGGNSRVYRSTDNGLTWTLRSTPGTGFDNARIFVSYRKRGGAANPSDTAQEVWLQRSASNLGSIFVSANAASTWTATLDLNTAGIEVPAAGRQNVLALFTWDSRYQFSAGRGTGGGANRWSIFATTNAATYSEPINGLVGNQDTVAVNGWPQDPNVFIMFSTSSSLCAISLDAGATRFGSAPTFFSPGPFVAYAEFSLVDIVPPT